MYRLPAQPVSCFLIVLLLLTPDQHGYRVEVNLHSVSMLVQQSRQHKSVTAVVPLSTEDGDSLLPKVSLKVSFQRPKELEAGVLH